jgi:hypothetical protein
MAPTISVSPTTIGQYGLIHVTGSGFTPNGNVTTLIGIGYGHILTVSGNKANGSGAISYDVLIGGNVPVGSRNTITVKDEATGTLSNTVSILVTSTDCNAWVKVKSGSPFNWYMHNAQNYTAGYKTAIDTLQPFADCVASYYSSSFGFSLPSPNPLTGDWQIQVDECSSALYGQAFGPGVRVGGGIALDDYLGHLFIAHEMANVFTFCSATACWPWADGSYIWAALAGTPGPSPFPRMCADIVLEVCGRPDLAQRARNEVLNDHGVQMLDWVRVQYGWTPYQGMFSLFQTKQVNLCNYQEPLPTALIITAMKMATGIDFVTLFNTLFTQYGVGIDSVTLSEAVQILSASIPSYMPVTILSGSGPTGAHLERDLIEADINLMMTHAAPTFKLKLDNRNERWSYLGWSSPIVIKVNLPNGTVFPILKGQIDTPKLGYGKAKPEGAYIELNGRGDQGRLDDIMSSLHFVNAAPNTIVTGIINEYNLRKQSNDPYITFNNPSGSELNKASQPGLPSSQMTFLWKRKSLSAMLRDVASALGAPASSGGYNEGFDFYIKPDDTFYFQGTNEIPSSGVTIPTNTQAIKAEKVLDSLTVKNDIWLCCASNAGRIPLTMQEGYPRPYSWYPPDTWTDYNSADWNTADMQSVTGVVDSTASVVGGYSVQFNLTQSIQPGQPGPNGYWSMPFPFVEKWPAQAPGGHLNAYNEIAMSETMGEMTALSFYLMSGDVFDMYLEVIDGSGNSAVSSSQHYPTGANIVPLDFVKYSFPFGPSAGSSYTVPPGGTPPDWSNIAKVRFHFTNRGPNNSSPNNSYICLDGFEIIKPLVVSALDPSAEIRRSDVRQANTISSYAIALDYVNGILVSESKPQYYWDITNVGRADIQLGSSFYFGSDLCLMRELQMKMSKPGGWTIIAKGFLAI